MIFQAFFAFLQMFQINNIRYFAYLKNCYLYNNSKYLKNDYTTVFLCIQKEFSQDSQTCILIGNLTI